MPRRASEAADRRPIPIRSGIGPPTDDRALHRRRSGAAAAGARARHHARRPAPRRRRAAAQRPAGEGLREPRRVVVVRARPAARLGRAAARASRPPATRCSCSTTCSPSSTGCAGSAWPRAIGGFEQVLVTAAVLEDVPEPLTARIVHIEAGRIVEEEATPMPDADEVRGRAGLRSTSARSSATNRAGRPGRAAQARTRETTGSEPFTPGRDPKALGDVIDGLTSQLGWTAPLAQHEVLASWAEIAGEETAQHTEPIAIEDGVLQVRCESTAWATQLRLMRTATRHRDRSSVPRARRSRRSASKGRTPPPGKGVPDRFQGVVHAIPTAEKANRSLRPCHRLRSALPACGRRSDLIGLRVARMTVRSPIHT